MDTVTKFILTIAVLAIVAIIFGSMLLLMSAFGEREIINQWREPHPDYDRFGGMLFATVRWEDGREEIWWYAEGMLFTWFGEADDVYHKLDESERDYIPESEWKYADLGKWVW